METLADRAVRGRVREVLVGANVQVAAQAPLLQLEPLDGGPPPASRRARRVRRSAAADRRRARRERAGAPRVARARLRRHAARGRADRRRPARRRPRRELHRRRAPAARDLRRRARAVTARATTRPTPRPRAAQPAGAPARLPALARRRGRGLARRVRGAAARALAHYGVDDLDRTPALEEACYRLFLAQQRAATARAASWPILERRLDRVAALRRSSAATDFREVLDRLVARDWSAATRSWPTSRARCATAPSTSRSSPPRASASTPRCEAHLAALAERPERARPRRAHRGARRLPAAARAAAQRAHARGRTAAAARLVEAMTRRYYRIRSLEALRARVASATTSC